MGDAARGEVAAGLLLTLPGTPMIFAGDEWGLRGDNGEGSRTPMPCYLDHDAATFAYYQALVGLRHAHPALRRGGLRWVHVAADTLVFLRETADEAILVLARRASGEPIRLAGLGAAANIYGGAPDLPADPTLPADGPTFQAWQL